MNTHTTAGGPGGAEGILALAGIVGAAGHQLPTATAVWFNTQTTETAGSS